MWKREWNLNMKVLKELVNKSVSSNNKCINNKSVTNLLDFEIIIL